MRSCLYYIVLGECIRGDVYASWRLTQATFMVSARYESIASEIQLENTLKLNSSTYNIRDSKYFVRVLIDFNIIIGETPVFHMIFYSFLFIEYLFGYNITSSIKSFY